MTTLLEDILRKLSPKDLNALKLKKCSDCGFYKNGYCTQSSPASKILTPYDAQLCPYYSPPQVIVTSKEAEEPIGYTKIDRVTLIDLITKISEITLIKKIEQIRDVSFSPKTLIINGSFETGDFMGWYIYAGNPTIGQSAGWGDYGVQFNTANDVLCQTLHTPLMVDWIAGINFNGYYSSAWSLKCRVWYTDLTSTSVVKNGSGLQNVTVLKSELTSGKYIKEITFREPNPVNMRMDDVCFLF